MPVYMAMLFLIILYACSKTGINRSEGKRKHFIIFAFSLLIIIACLRSSSVGRDLNAHYAKNFMLIAQRSWSELPMFSVISGYEIGYVYYCKIISYIIKDPQILIITSSLFIYGVHARFFYRHSENVVMSTILFILSCSYYMYMNVIRQGIAGTIILLGYEVLWQRRKEWVKYIFFISCTVVASTFHKSALLCLIFLLFYNMEFKRRHILLSVAASAAAVFSYQKLYLVALSFLGNNKRYADHILSRTEGTGGLSLIGGINILLTSGAFLIACYVYITGKRKGDPTKSPVFTRQGSMLMYLCLMAGVCRLLGTKMNIINRMTFFFLPFIFILYPVGINRTGRFRQLFTTGVYALYGMYFIYMSVYLAADYYGVIPYLFFWQK